MQAVVLAAGVGVGVGLPLLVEAPTRDWGPLWLQRLGSQASVSLVPRNSDQASLWLKRARFHRRIGELEAALSDYNMALARHTQQRDLVVFSERGRLLQRLGRDREALNDFNRAIAFGPKAASLTLDGPVSLAQAYQGRADLLLQQGRREEAKRDLRASLNVFTAAKAAASER